MRFEFSTEMNRDIDDIQTLSPTSQRTSLGKCTHHSRARPDKNPAVESGCWIVPAWEWFLVCMNR